MAGAADGILVGYDGSPGSEQALSWAAREARARGMALTVCHAWAPGFPVPPGEAAVLDLARRSGERVIADGLQHAHGVMGSGTVQPLLVEGSAAAVLCERSQRADMVVLGSQGCGGVAGQLLGSVSLRVAAHARGRVVIVRGHWRPAGGYVPGPIVANLRSSWPRCGTPRCWRSAPWLIHQEAWAAPASVRKISSKRSARWRRSIPRWSSCPTSPWEVRANRC